ncbi:MAG: hypothetical protein FWH33_08300 [Oscillospiraceae bacterium]|nr:hypothetical protein [Oscillospiraceae bacterium]
MSFCTFKVFPIGANASSYAYATTDQNGKILQEKWDNGLNRMLAATALNFYSFKTDIKTDGELYISFGGEALAYFTDSRIVVSSKQFSQGTIKWEHVSTDISDKKKQKGKVLLGQIRYEWLHKIGFSRKAGFLSFDTISLTHMDTDRYYMTILSFPKGTDTEFVANEVLARACKYRLAMNDVNSASDIEFLKHYSEGGKIGPSADPDKTPSIILPNNYIAPTGEEYRPTW